MKSSTTRSLLATASLVLAYLLCLPTPSRADEFNLKTYITVSQPVRVPGAILEPDVKYVFRRLGADAGMNNVVRVLNADETKVIATFFAISDQRLEPADHTVLTFYETVAGAPKPIRSWFYPGRTIGFEFLYPKKEMREITAHLKGKEPVEVQSAQYEKETYSPQPTEEAVQPQPQQSAQSTVPEVQRATPPEAEQNNTTVTPPSSEVPAELPRTAGELPLIGLIGLAALGLRRLLGRV